MSDIIGTPVTVTVSGVRRMPRSPNGNPRYIFDTDNGDIYSTRRIRHVRTGCGDWRLRVSA